VFNASYGFGLFGERLSSFSFISDTMQTVQRALPGWLPVPLPRDAVLGFDSQRWEADALYPATLFGEGYFGGDWRYYPWLVLTQTTLGGVALLVLCAASFALRKPQAEEVPLLVLAAGVWLGMSVTAQINIGIRYLLPLYAPIIILMGRTLAGGVASQSPRWLRASAWVATGLLVVESVVATPRFHSFCNLATRRWWREVPNQDWGQGLIHLRDWMREHDQDRIGLLYFGSVDPAIYGIDAADPFAPPSTQYVAVSRAMLEGIPAQTTQGFAFVRPWRRLRELVPTADLDGLLVFRAAEVAPDPAVPWAIRVHDWHEVLKEPTLIKLRNLDERIRQAE
jgi:hypothetical protein